MTLVLQGSFLRDLPTRNASGDQSDCALNFLMKGLSQAFHKKTGGSIVPTDVDAISLELTMRVAYTLYRSVISSLVSAL